MRRQLIVLLAVISMLGVFGQNSVDTTTTTEALLKNQNTLGAFLSYPLGNFGSTDITNGGFALPGWGLSYDSKSTLGKHLSFISHSTYSWLNLDDAAMEKELSEAFKAKTIIENGQHQPFFTTVGFNYDFFLGQRLSIGLNAQAGILYNSFKPFTVSIYDSSNVLLFNDIVSYESAFAFAYCFGADLNFMLIKNVLGIQLNLDYSASKLSTYMISKSFAPIKSLEKLEMLNIGASLVFYK